MNDIDYRENKKRKCLNHPAMECPNADKPCVFIRIERPEKAK